MKKTKNKGIRILGIIMSMIGLALLVRPLIAMVLGNKLEFSFFGLFDGILVLIISVLILIGGLLILSVSEPLEEEKK